MDLFAILRFKFIRLLSANSFLPDTKDSIVAILFSVACPSKPPNVTMGAKHAKYRKRNEDKHWGCNPLKKSER